MTTERRDHTRECPASCYGQPWDSVMEEQVLEKCQTCKFSPSSCAHTWTQVSGLEQLCKLPAISCLNKRISVLEERAFRTVRSCASLLRILVLRTPTEIGCSSFRKRSVSSALKICFELAGWVSQPPLNPVSLLGSLSISEVSTNTESLAE